MRLMRERFDRAVRLDEDNRRHMLEDLKFEAGEQWPTNVKDDREKDGRPCLTIPRTSQFKRQITGDIRLNKPAIKVRPVDDKADKKTAEVINGLIRNIEDQSRASYVYAIGAENSVTCGQGACRIVTQYADDDSFEQDIRIKAIPNALSVVWDNTAIEPDKSDAEYCFVHYRMSKREGKRTYPDATLIDFEVTGDDVDASRTRDWFSDDDFRVAEYWCKKPYKKTLYKLLDGRVLDDDGIKAETEARAAMGLEFDIEAETAQTREVDCKKVYQYIVSGHEVLAGPIEWAGRYIPIIPFVGEEIWVGENRIVRGIIRPLKDAQQLFNYMRSASAEVIALQPKQPWLVTPAMIEGFEQQWREAGKKNSPFLLYNADPLSPGLTPQRQLPPQQATGFIAEAGLASEDMNAVTGIYPPALGQKSNETSGKAIIARDRQSDVSTFVFIDNIAYAISTVGKQLVDLIPRIYDTERVVRVLGEDGSIDAVMVNKAMQGPSGSMVKYDLTVGKYDVTVDTGPSFTSRRQEAAQGMTEFVQAVPMAAPLVGDLLAEAQDWPNAEKLKERLQVLLPPELRQPQLGPDGKPVPPPPPPPDPEMLKMQAQAQAEEQKMKFEQARAVASHQLARQQAQEKAVLAKWEAEQGFALEAWKAQQQMALEAYKAQLQAGLKAEEVKTNIDLKSAEFQATQELTAQDRAEKAAKDEEAKAREDERDRQSSDAQTKTIETLAEMVEGMKTVAKTLARPKTVKFDKDGMPVGVE